MNTQTVTENIVILKDSVRAEELNLGGKSLSKKNFWEGFSKSRRELSLGKDSIAIYCVYLYL